MTFFFSLYRQSLKYNPSYVELQSTRRIEDIKKTVNDLNLNIDQVK